MFFLSSSVKTSKPTCFVSSGAVRTAGAAAPRGRASFTSVPSAMLHTRSVHAPLSDGRIRRLVFSAKLRPVSSRLRLLRHRYALLHRLVPENSTAHMRSSGVAQRSTIADCLVHDSVPPTGAHSCRFSTIVTRYVAAPPDKRSVCTSLTSSQLRFAPCSWTNSVHSLRKESCFVSLSSLFSILIFLLIAKRVVSLLIRSSHSENLRFSPFLFGSILPHDRVFHKTQNPTRSGFLLFYSKPSCQV